MDRVDFCLHCAACIWEEKENVTTKCIRLGKLKSENKKKKRENIWNMWDYKVGVCNRLFSFSYVTQHFMSSRFLLTRVAVLTSTGQVGRQALRMLQVSIVDTELSVAISVHFERSVLNYKNNYVHYKNLRK